MPFKFLPVGHTYYLLYGDHGIVGIYKLRYRIPIIVIKSFQYHTTLFPIKTAL